MTLNEMPRGHKWISGCPIAHSIVTGVESIEVERGGKTTLIYTNGNTKIAKLDIDHDREFDDFGMFELIDRVEKGETKKC